MPIIWETPSKSGGKPHRTVLEDDGVFGCSCRGWIIKRANKPRCCKHIETYVAEHGLTLEVRGDYVALASGVPAVAAAVAVPAADLFVNLPVLPDGAKLPEPMLASQMIAKLTGAAFDAKYGDGKWAAEEKLDGERKIVIKYDDGSVFCFSRPREGEDMIAFPLPNHIKAALAYLDPGIYDGEVCVPGGKSWDVRRLENRDKLVLVLFDVLSLRGEDVTKLAYSERRYALLMELVKLPADQVAISTVESLTPSWAMVLEIWARGGEGVILKRLDSPYWPGARPDFWVKVKELFFETFEIYGFEAGKNGPYSKLMLRDKAGIETTVKTLDNASLRDIAKNPAKYLGARMVCSYQTKTPSGKYRHLMWDHLAGEGE